ncbi:MAG: aldo/keto reductase [Candidatus Glassbacteria bacterium]|nr:aldo/keto reductase [Candidatus Glassbacteria bacterium]
MKTIGRRSFIRQAIAGAGAAALPWACNGASQVDTPAGSFAADDRVALGKTGIVVSRLALGSGTHGVGRSSNQTRIGLDNFVGIIRHGFERDLIFWDTADQYGSHTYFREVLKHVPREKVVILTKSTAREPGQMRQDLERFRQELGTELIDILLLHCMTEENWPAKLRDTMDVVSEAREQGILRSCGVSCHSLAALQAAARDPWTEVILTRLNHAGVAMDAEPEQVLPVLREAHGNGKAVIAMKIVGVGKLKDQIDRSLGFVLARDFVDAFTIGFESPQELDQMIQKIAAVRA